MRLERLNYNKLKVFVTYDDLKERGLTKEDLWTDTFKVKQLFREMIEQASKELNFEPTSSLSVEIFSLQAQGMVVFVTKQDSQDEMEIIDEHEDMYEEFIEMQVMLDESHDLFFEFQTFEDVIQLAKRINQYYDIETILYSFENRFYVLVGEEKLTMKEIGNIIALLAEYGSPSTITKHRVQEYGKQLIHNQALSYIADTFS
ncbi:genetic competence negative regulator [Priestia flexa]|jgi:adapter protein MecA 1/2|uniref:Adapter protein MecA n=2 Tax=Priestia TaxID=2800373 RepID=A0A0V8JR06_9BACI|nr:MULTISPECIES: genetic competence negative regulator [Priestia]KSU89529.1 adaptor protein [Priestia veravalensis]MBN8250252.1 genetic competence negative regulator [Priestia flexa]MBN8432926.1 genetic competence negative regulator [Priestia flexa]MBY6084965.1 genetic competence negative regulator [Priestia flexa]MCA0965088.1 genetic competence negative regulator [Priestia flexa]